MSHDQRPGKLRVVQDGGGPQRRASDPVTIDGKAVTVTGAPSVPVGPLSGAAGGAPAKQGLPIVSALLFLLACAAGGVAVALFRPFGLG